MTDEERLLFYRSLVASLIFHLVSGVFLWKVQVPAPALSDPSPLVVSLLPSSEIPRFIDQPDAPPATGPVKSKDISQVTSEARGPGKVPGPVTSRESSGTPKPGRPPDAGRIAQAPTSPPVPRQPATTPAPTSEPAGESPPLARPDASPSAPTAPEVRPSLREQIAALGSGGVSAVDAGEEGDTGTGERIVSLETQSSEYAPYLADVKRRIERRWQIPPYAREVGLTGRLVLVFSITPEGNLAQVRITDSSGTSVLDEAAVQAVRAAAPYAPFPPMFTFERLTIVADFRYVDRGRPVKPSR
jgi:protein TonB